MTDYEAMDHALNFAQWCLRITGTALVLVAVLILLGDVVQRPRRRRARGEKVNGGFDERQDFDSMDR